MNDPTGKTLLLSRRAWQGIAIVLFVIAISWGVCGLLLGAMPTEPTETVPNPESVSFWLTRGCFLGPAFSLLFLAYASFMAGRRRGRSVRYSELATALGVALGLLPVWLGLAISVQPASSDPVGDRTVSALFCLLPGLFIVAVCGIFWALVVRKNKIAK